LESEREERAPRRERKGGEEWSDTIVDLASGWREVEECRPFWREGRYCFPLDVVLVIV
jgi:hypothetical protein